MDKWEYKVTRVIFSNQISFNETQNEVNDKINKKQIIEFNSIGENGWELVQILPRSKGRQIPCRFSYVEKKKVDIENIYQ